MSKFPYKPLVVPKLYPPSKGQLISNTRDNSNINLVNVFGDTTILTTPHTEPFWVAVQMLMTGYFKDYVKGDDVLNSISEFITGTEINTESEQGEDLYSYYVRRKHKTNYYYSERQVSVYDMIVNGFRMNANVIVNADSFRAYHYGLCMNISRFYLPRAFPDDIWGYNDRGVGVWDKKAPRPTGWHVDLGNFDVNYNTEAAKTQADNAKRFLLTATKYQAKAEGYDIREFVSPSSVTLGINEFMYKAIESYRGQLPVGKSGVILNVFRTGAQAYGGFVNATNQTLMRAYNLPKATSDTFPNRIGNIVGLISTAYSAKGGAAINKYLSTGILNEAYDRLNNLNNTMTAAPWYQYGRIAIYTMMITIPSEQNVLFHTHMMAGNNLALSDSAGATAIIARIYSTYSTTRATRYFQRGIGTAVNTTIYRMPYPLWNFPHPRYRNRSNWTVSDEVSNFTWDVYYYARQNMSNPKYAAGATLLCNLLTIYINSAFEGILFKHVDAFNSTSPIFNSKVSTVPDYTDPAVVAADYYDFSMTEQLTLPSVSWIKALGYFWSVILDYNWNNIRISYLIDELPKYGFAMNDDLDEFLLLND